MKRRWSPASSMPSKPNSCASSAPPNRPPSWKAAKSFAKSLLRQADVPTAEYQVFREAAHAITFLRDREDIPVVVKADGLAGGKGVFVCNGRTAAIEAVKRIAEDKQFAEAGNQILIEERLDGQEVSVLAITDGRTIITLPAAQDHKAAFDGDTGPNTGGMGAYCPTPVVSDADLHRIEEQFLVPVDPCHEARPPPLPRRAVRRPDDDQPGPQSVGIQRPLRRSGVPDVADALAKRSGRTVGCHDRRSPGACRAAAMGSARLRSRS